MHSALIREEPLIPHKSLFSYLFLYLGHYYKSYQMKFSGFPQPPQLLFFSLFCWLLLCLHLQRGNGKEGTSPMVVWMDRANPQSTNRHLPKGGWTVSACSEETKKASQFRKHAVPCAPSLHALCLEAFTQAHGFQCSCLQNTSSTTTAANVSSQLKT